MVSIEPLTDDRVPAVIACARRYANASDSFERVLRARWIDDSDHGLLLQADGDVVGYCTALHSRRIIDGRERRFVALGPWFVRTEYRAHSLRLMARMLQPADRTWVTHTPNRKSEKVLKRFRFHYLDTRMAVFLPFARTFRTVWHGWRLHTDPRVLTAELDPETAAVWRDHTKHGCVGVLVVGHGRRCFLIAKRRTLRRVPTSELLFVSDVDVLLRCFERVRLTLHRLDRTALLMADERLFRSRPIPAGLRRQRARMFRSPDLKPEQIDNLYSEIVVV